MHSHTRKFGVISVLLPLVLLLVLSCPMKREVRELLHLPVNTEAGSNNSTHSRICIVSVFSVAKTNYNKRYIKKTSSFLFTKDAVSGIVQSVLHPLRVNIGYTRSCPPFIYFRKILI